MEAKFQSWWQKIKQHSFISAGSIIVLIALIAFIFAAYRFGWSATGFLNKTLWDWLQLLIIPLALAVIALLFNRATSRTEQKIALDRQREDLLQKYLDCMSDLLLKEKLRSSAADAEVRNFARVRTITLLFQLDARRIGYVFAFLRESGLMSVKPTGSILSLHQANLRKVTWSQAELFEVDLQEANLKGADLRQANLFLANLTRADLTGADLRSAELTRADLSKAQLTSANLIGADLTRADLSEAQLAFASLNRAILQEAKLTRANLIRADLRFANLSEANLTRADFSGANLQGANLKGAKYNTKPMQETDAQEKRITLKTTRWPEGFDPQAAGAVCVDS